MCKEALKESRILVRNTKYNKVIVNMKKNLLPQVFHMAKAGGETVVVCNHNRRIQWLEIQNENRVAIETRFRLHN